MTTSTRALVRRAAAVAVLVTAAVALPARSDATDKRINGVRATIRGGTLVVQGGDGADAVTLRLQAGNPDRVEVDVNADGSSGFSFARSELSAINVKVGDGNDSVRVDDANGAFTDAIPTTIAGGDGDDSLVGGLGAETFRAGDGNDTVIGGKGNDVTFLGDGNDTFIWNNGDASDVIEGQNGSDKMVFNGAAVGEDVTMTANGRRLKFFRVQGNVTMDTDGVEAVDFNALGGTDNVTVSDLTRTDVTETNLDLAGTLGGTAGDGVVDNVIVNGTDGDDAISVNGAGSGVDVTGLATKVSIGHADVTDTLSIDTFAGTDRVSVTGVDGVMQVKVDGEPV